MMVEASGCVGLAGMKGTVIAARYRPSIRKNYFTVSKILHWLDDLYSQRAMTPSILSILLNHTLIVSQQVYESP